tara:strand:+ start:5070 stop:6452 length:1383 start_codon:yes stop_codon:yes gene_type:complete
MSIFSNISPLDYRYYGRSEKIKKKLEPFLSEEGFVKYKAKVELALVKVFSKRGVCSEDIYEEVKEACEKVTAEEVYNEEDKIRHDIRALANCIRDKVSDKAKPFVHFTATSYDIVDTANSLRYKEVTQNVLLPDLVELEKTLISLAEREKDTLQIGRTHGQHAEPITFGFALAGFVSRLGKRILKIKETAGDLRGKMAGAVGSYNASSVFFDEPEKFEEEVLAELNLKPSPHSTQIVEHEFMLDFVHSIVSCFGVLANIADDLRHLQRTEISEVAESFGEKQVGSSTMPHKRNPINFENVKSMWKEFMPRMITLYSDQISEHQRDLTNSASSRFIAEIIAGLVVSVNKLNKVLVNLVVDKENIKKNFDKNKNMIIAEPLYILLAAHNHPDAHEYVRKLTLESQKTGKPVEELFFNDKNEKYINKFTEEQMNILKNPERYTGIAAKKAEKICREWKDKLNI